MGFQQEVVRKSAGGEDGEKKDSDDDSGSIVDWSEEERVILGPFGLDDDTDSELQLDEPQEASSEANASSSSGCSRLAAGRSEDGAERRREKLMRDIVKVAGKVTFRLVGCYYQVSISRWTLMSVLMI